MFKSFLIGSIAVMLNAPSAFALPTYAGAVARDYCQYLQHGYNWDEATSQSLRDNYHWVDEMNRDGNLASRNIQIAIYELCPDLAQKAWNQHNQSL